MATWEQNSQEYVRKLVRELDQISRTAHFTKDKKDGRTKAGKELAAEMDEVQIAAEKIRIYLTQFDQQELKYK